MKRCKFICIVLFSFVSLAIHAQVKVSAELRPRFEYRHGVKSLASKNQKAAMFVSQRSRLNLDYKKDKVKMYISVQNIHVWGDTKQLSLGEVNGFAVNQAWGQLGLLPNLSLKFGRQPISYDDQRILGGADWAQQARTHDVAILKYNKEGLKVDLGFAFNQLGQNLIGTSIYSNSSYKALQYLWFNKSSEQFSGSFLFLNNGAEVRDSLSNYKTVYSQTAGVHLKTKGKFSLAANAYYQFGKDSEERNLSAYLAGLVASYKANPNMKYSLGFEMQSGNSFDTPLNENKAFTPFYGTNHRYNGHLDYFYTGNHINNVGLINIFAQAGFTIKEKSSFNVAIHNFMTAGKMNANAANQLGQEIDLSYKYKFNSIVTISAGYSHLFPTVNMEILKGGSSETINNWGWLMIAIKPTLFDSKPK